MPVPCKENNIIFQPISACDYPLFHQLLNAYYREGEDASTDQADIDNFIAYLFELCLQKRIRGCIATASQPIGFALWMLDDGSEFSNMPGCGTILEIGVEKEARGHGVGQKIVRHAEEDMKHLGIANLYVCAYGPAESFWSKCGYGHTEKTAQNGLRIFVKQLS